ncbi:MAG: hypothetical protein ACRCTQ_03975 [Brevinemataceae bacterium]
MKTKFLLLFIMLLTSCSTSLDQQRFLRELVNEYELTETGKVFIMQCKLLDRPVSEKDIIFINGTSELIYKDTTAGNVKLAHFVEMKSSTGVFQLTKNNKFIELQLLEKRILLASTNAKWNISDLTTEFLVPIGITNGKLPL